MQVIFGCAGAARRTLRLWQIRPDMAVERNSRIVVAGAGSIGCYVGGCLALAGRDVTLLLRPVLADAISRHGLRISDLDGADRTLPSSALTLTTDPSAALAAAEIVLVTVKSGATADMAKLIARHAPAEAIVVSLQNGVGNVDVLRAHLRRPRSAPLPGMVPFNVVQSRADGDRPRFHRATSGTMLIAAGVAGLREALDVPGAAVAEHADMTGVLWGKLLLNLNNALNALSDLPLARELADRRWRLPARRADRGGAGGPEGRRHPSRPHRRRAAARDPIRSCACPTVLFRLVARRMLAIDPQARSSMWEDLRLRRPTEIDHLQGAILALADKAGVAAPLTERIAAPRQGRGKRRRRLARLAAGQVASVAR